MSQGIQPLPGKDTSEKRLTGIYDLGQEKGEGTGSFQQGSDYFLHAPPLQVARPGLPAGAVGLHSTSIA